MDKSVKIALVLIFVIMLVVGGIFAATKINKSGIATSIEVNQTGNEEDTLMEEPKGPNIEIFKGTDRPIAFMIDNNVNAQPQSSINKAYVVYEIIVEGNETRLMAVFKGAEADVIGPMRSARHYFLDYAMEHDAIYTHLGLSPQAGDSMTSYKINNINGQDYDTGKARTEASKFWRSKRAAPHNAYTNIEKVLEIAADKKYKTTSNVTSPLKYVEEEVTLESDIIANTVTIPYASKHTVEYKYDEETMRYTRYSKGKKQTDDTTKEDITMKNIIITFAKNYTMDDSEDKGRQEVVTVGSLDGYYITNGKAIKITCKKDNRKAQTKYLDEEGNEIEINDGNTFINVCPDDAKVTFK